MIIDSKMTERPDSSPELSLDLGMESSPSTVERYRSNILDPKTGSIHRYEDSSIKEASVPNPLPSQDDTKQPSLPALTDSDNPSMLPVMPVAVEELDEILHPSPAKSSMIHFSTKRSNFLTRDSRGGYGRTFIDRSTKVGVAHNLQAEHIDTDSRVNRGTASFQTSNGYASNGSQFKYRFPSRQPSPTSRQSQPRYDAPESRRPWTEKVSSIDRADINQKLFDESEENANKYPKELVFNETDLGSSPLEPSRFLGEVTVDGRPTGPSGPTDDPSYGVDNFQSLLELKKTCSRSEDPKTVSTPSTIEKNQQTNPTTSRHMSKVFNSNQQAGIMSKKRNGIADSSVRMIFQLYISECCEYVAPNSPPSSLISAGNRSQIPHRNETFGRQSTGYLSGISMVSRHDMYERYKIWCSDRGHQSVGGNIFIEFSDDIFSKCRHKKKWYYTDVRLR